MTHPGESDTEGDVRTYATAQETAGLVCMHVDAPGVNLIVSLTPGEAMELAEALQTEAVLCNVA